MRYSAILAAALALSAAACTPATTPAAQPAPGAVTDAASAQRTWEAQRPAAYAYEMEVQCFCLHRGRFALEVRDGRITSARNAETGALAEASQVEWLLTVDRLFQAMRQAAQAGTPVRAEYHPQLGYPVEVEIGMLANDSGTLYRIENLRAL